MRARSERSQLGGITRHTCVVDCHRLPPRACRWHTHHRATSRCVRQRSTTVRAAEVRTGMQRHGAAPLPGRCCAHKLGAGCACCMASPTKRDARTLALRRTHCLATEMQVSLCGTGGTLAAKGVQVVHTVRVRLRSEHCSASRCVLACARIGHTRNSLCMSVTSGCGRLPYTGGVGARQLAPFGDRRVHCAP